MQIVISLLWLLGSVYAVVNIVRPIRPLTKRWHGVVALFGVSILCSALAAPFASSRDPQVQPVQQAAQPSPRTAEVATAKDFELVRTDPSAPAAKPSASATEDADRARSEMKEYLRLIDAAEGVLVTGMNAANREAVELVRRDMQRLDVKLIQRRPALDAEPWPASADEGFAACEQAAQRLSAFAASAVQRLSLEEVAARQKFGDDYANAHKKCSAWVR